LRRQGAISCVTPPRRTTRGTPASSFLGSGPLALATRLTRCFETSSKIEGYELVYDPAQERWAYTHRLADEYNLRNGVYTEQAGTHRHHVDFNKDNNNPTNLRRMTEDEHLQVHRVHADKTLRRPEVLEKLRVLRKRPEFRDRVRQKMLQPAMRKLLRERARKQWADPQYRDYMTRRFLDFYDRSPEYRAVSNRRLLKAQRVYWSQATHRKKQAERVTRYFQLNPQAKEVLSRMAQEQWADPELVVWRRGQTRKQWTPEFREKRKKAYSETYRHHSLQFMSEVLRTHGTIELYDELRRRPRNNNLLTRKTLAGRFFGGDERKMKEAAAHYNHRVRGIRKLNERLEVYDLEVPDTHNFALAGGVFVHNSARQGRDRRFQAILPIKGKIINVEKARLEKVLGNDEVRTIITALGAGVGEEFSIEKLRYKKVILMADADVDGAHIRTLLLTLFYRQLPELIKQGNIFIAQPPLYKVKRGKREEYVYSEPALNEFLFDLGLEGVKLVNTKEKREYTETQAKELLRLLTEVEHLGRSLQKKGVDFQKYLLLKHPKTKKLPIFKVKVEEITHFLYSDDELAKLTKGEKEVDTLEIYEAGELEELGQKLAKLGVDLKDFEFPSRQQEPPKTGRRSTKAAKKAESAGQPALFKIINEKEEGRAHSLLELLTLVRNLGKRGLQVQRYKGLGEMNPTQLWETTMDPEKRTLQQVSLSDAVEAETIFTTLMGDEVEPRRLFIEEHAPEVRFLDV
jgi:DNA gyrase subunit B